MASRIGNIFAIVLVGLLVVAGPAFVVWGSIAGQRYDAVVREGVRTEGTVTEFADALKASDRKVVVTFTDADGRTHTARGLARSSQHPKVGDRAPVAYRKGDPGDNALPSYDEPNSSLLGMGVILTVVFWGVPLLLFWRGRRRRRRERRLAEVTAG